MIRNLEAHRSWADIGWLAAAAGMFSVFVGMMFMLFFGPALPPGRMTRPHRHRQVLVRAGGADGQAWHDCHFRKPRRHGPQRHRRWRSFSLEGAGHQRQVQLHIRQARRICLFLRPSPVHEGQGHRRAVSVRGTCDDRFRAQAFQRDGFAPSRRRLWARALADRESDRRRRCRAGRLHAGAGFPRTAVVERPRAWLLTIVRNTAFSWMGKNRPKAVVLVGDSELLDAATAHRDASPVQRRF